MIAKIGEFAQRREVGDEFGGPFLSLGGCFLRKMSNSVC